MKPEKLICSKCNKELELTSINLEYLGHRMTHQFPTCPVCKLIYIPEEVVMGKMQQIERELEDK